MRNFKLLLQREPAAVGSLVASLLPVMVLMGVIQIDGDGIAAVVVAINTIVGFAIRVLVSPTGMSAPTLPPSAAVASPAVTPTTS